MATPTTESVVVTTAMTDSRTDDMKFNDSHLMSIATYSILMAVSAVANSTVLVNILRRKRALRFGNNHMFMHLAIADLLVSAEHKFGNQTLLAGGPDLPWDPRKIPFRFVQRVKQLVREAVHLHQVSRLECVELHLQSSIRLHGVVVT